MLNSVNENQISKAKIITFDNARTEQAKEVKKEIAFKETDTVELTGEFAEIYTDDRQEPIVDKQAFLQQLQSQKMVRNGASPAVKNLMSQISSMSSDLTMADIMRLSTQVQSSNGDNIDNHVLIRAFNALNINKKMSHTMTQ